MKSIKPKLLIRLIILALGGALLIFSTQDIYRYWLRSKRVNEKFVQFYRPQLNTELVKEAVEILK